MVLNALNTLPFMKMHGAGNDFVVIDGREALAELSPGMIRALADRHRGVGFDQLALLGPGRDLSVTFFNADGSPSAACGNATRCIATREMALRDADALTIEVTGRGDLQAVRSSSGDIAVNMQPPLLEWSRIPLAEDVDTLSLPIEGAPVATGMGNPHCTFFVDDVEAIDLASFGAEMEHHPLYPQRTNVQVAQVIGTDRLRMRVWERGTGITLASGSSSCAAAVAAARRGLTGRKVEVVLDGGTLQIDWRDDGVWMAGPAVHVFDGVLTPEFLASL